MRVFVVASLVCLLSQSAGAITCEQVRGYVHTYGLTAVMAYVRSAGISQEDVRRGRACLRRASLGHRRRADRLWSGSWQSN